MAERLSAFDALSVAAGGDIPALAHALRDRDKRVREIDTQLAPRETPNETELRAALEQRVREWRDVLRRNPRQGRMVLEASMGPLEIERPTNVLQWAVDLMNEPALVG